MMNLRTSHPHPHDEERQPTLQEVRRAHGLTSRRVADEAGVALRIEYLLEIGGAVSRADAQRVLEALSRLTHTPYTEQDFQGLCIRDPTLEARSKTVQTRRSAPHSP